MKKHQKLKSMEEVAVALGLPASRGLEADVKARLTAALIREVERRKLTHQEVAELSGVARSTVTGIVTGSLQRVTVDRLLRILGAVGLAVDVKIRRAG